ncbi:hypothetical protein, partial [Pseudomonas aeruginosa]
TCRFGHYNCLRELPPGLVLQALERLVGGPPPGGRGGGPRVPLCASRDR